MHAELPHLAEFTERMRKARVAEPAICAFEHAYGMLVRGETGLVPESTIEAIESLPRLEDIASGQNRNSDLLSQVAVLKLNGGLGTGMGLEKAKSLLQVKNGYTFLDFIARHLLYLRKHYEEEVAFLLLNSFSTSQDTRHFLTRYRELGDVNQMEVLQNQVPKIDASTLRPIAWPGNPKLEWCPPGHGDIYPSLLGSGSLERLLSSGVRFLFVSNADNLGASLDLDLLTYFAGTGSSFLMEVAERTPSDRKGGHLARRGGRYMLRESAQCGPEDMGAFQDISRHRFFNTNNLWIRLESLKDALEEKGGFLPLPMIRNEKTVDPRDKKSKPVLQLETAMGAAIELFEDSTAVVVPRSRFAPVKTIADLLGLRSDAYEVTEDWRLVLANKDRQRPPTIDLDPTCYRLVEQLDASLAEGIPSLLECDSLSVKGPVGFSNSILRGRVVIQNDHAERRTLPIGEYADCTIGL